MQGTPLRVLVVDDYEPWRRHIQGTVRANPLIQVVGEARDGPGALEKARDLWPDLILLDVGLPKLNGFETAHLIFRDLPQTKILFVSENRSCDFAEEAFRLGASGYLTKSSAGEELDAAIEAVRHGSRFISADIMAQYLTQPEGHRELLLAPVESARSDHVVALYDDDAAFTESFSGFIAENLSSGASVIAVLTKAHRVHINERLQDLGATVEAARSEGRFVLLDVEDTLPRLLTDRRPDASRFALVINQLVTKARKAAIVKSSPVAACGECAPTLLAQGDAESAIHLERLWDRVTRMHGMSTFCGYMSHTFPNQPDSPVLQRIVAEHSGGYASEPAH